MSGRELVILGLVVSAPLTLALLVALVRGYTITLHMTREHTPRRHES